ncbi:MAG TPA: IS1595 family transposase [Rhizomicrobium sp.]|jgi:transposase-like protein
MTPVELSSPVYSNEDAARAHLEAIRWPDGVTCPHCGSADEARALGGESMGPGWYYCEACQDKFTVRSGTVYERSHVPLHKWLLAFRLMASSKKGMSAHQLHRTLGVTYKTAWFMAHRIREAMGPAKGKAGPMGGEGKVVEADTTYVGGKERNKHVGKRDGKKIGGVGKQIVHTLVERGGKARSHHIPNVSGKTLRPILFGNVDRKSALMTDTAGGYLHLGKEFASHEMVDHSADEYVRGNAHSNTVEGYFATLKRGIVGTYHHVSEAHLQAYLHEFDFRHSNRSALKVDDCERTTRAIKGAEGKRLQYRQPNKTANA